MTRPDRGAAVPDSEGAGALKLVLPKGSLEQATLALFDAADLPVKRGSEREYHGTIDDPRVERVSLLRPQEIPRYVEDGFFDLGITGRDWIEETEADVVSLAELPYSKQTSSPVRVVLAVHRDLGVTRPDQLQPGLRVSTEFPNLTRRFFDDLGLAARVFPSYGATEAKVPEIVDAVVDLTETGSTLRSHGMVVIATLLTSWTEVVANRQAAADPERRQAMDDLVTLLAGAARARSKTLIKLNVADGDLAKVVEVLPAMKAPTITELADSGYHAVEAVVDKAVVNRLIPTLKGAGAFDILELPIAKIVE
jgi:ATP phosphoribosyltransferase